MCPAGILLAFPLSTACTNDHQSNDTYGKRPKLEAPSDTRDVVHHPVVVGWAPREKPVPADGFVVSLWAKDFDYPRWAYVLPNGDVLVAEARTKRDPKKEAKTPPEKVQQQLASKSLGESADRISLLRDADKDGIPEFRNAYLSDLSQPFGMCLAREFLYIANTDALVRVAYRAGDVQAGEVPERVLELPAGGHNNHWTRNVVAAPDGRRLFMTVGSGRDDAEGDQDDPDRAALWVWDLDAQTKSVYARGLRNPVGLAFHPLTSRPWAAVNERDELGDDLPPDYITEVREGGFYGWPYAYWGANVDPRHRGKREDLVSQSIRPDYALGNHTASLGLAFVPDTWPERYRGGAVIGQHGSWNRSSFTGYRVIFVPFRNGKPSGPPETLLSGFIGQGKDVYGRPCGVTFLDDGRLLVMDDAGNSIWCLQPARR